MIKYLFAVLVLASSAAYAETSNVEVTCVKPQDLEVVLNKWKELPLARGQSARTNDETRNTLVIFVNHKTGTWTIAERTPGGLYCILAAGEKFEPVPAEVVEKFKKQQEGL